MLRILVYSLIPLVARKTCNAYFPFQLRVNASPFFADKRTRVIEVLTNCQVPDDWLLKNKRPLLHGREVLQAVLATWQSSAKELLC